jgi:signal transduction histidine kinase/HAMP domain-containing protein
MNITTKFFLTLTGLILIASIATIIISETISKNIMETQISEKMEINTLSRASHLKTILDEYLKHTEMLAVGNSFKDAVDEDKNYTERIEQVNRRIHNTLESRSNIHTLMILDRNGTVIASNLNITGEDKSTDLLFIEGKKKSSITDIHFCKISGNPVISTAAPIYLDGIFAGVCIVCYSAASDLYRITTDTTGLGETGEIYLVNKDGYMISPSRFLNNTVLVQDLNDIEEFALYRNYTGFYRNYLGNEVLGVHLYIPEIEWCIIGEINKEEAFAPIVMLNNSIKIAVLFFIFSGIMVSLIMSRTVTKPISDLIAGVREIRSGNLDHTIDIKTGDEIELFAHEFNQMSTELKKSYSNLEEQVDKRTQEYQTAYHQLEEEMNERKKINELLKNQQTMEEAYADILTVTNNTSDMESLLSAGLNSLMKYTNSPVGIIYLYNSRRNVLVPKASQGADKIAASREFSPGEGIPGETAQKKKMIVVTDIPKDTVFRIESGLCETHPETIISTPMVFKEMILGVVLTCHTGKVSAEMQAFIKRVVDQYAVSVNNANTFAQTQEMAFKLKNQRDELEIQSHELEEASKTKSEFLANMSHELRTPLNSIIGFTEILHDQTFGQVNEKQLKYLNNVLTSGKHLLSLINDILDLSKVEAGKAELIYEEFDVSVPINEVRTLVTSVAAKKNIEIDVLIAPELTIIRADIGKFKQILFNLLSNAIKFSPDNATVTIDVRCTGDMALISVADKGIGISKQDQEKLFNSFVQIDSSTSRQYNGTGLGLALVKRFVEMHGGRVWVESEPEKGSTFIFTIPISGEVKVIQVNELQVEPESVIIPEESKTPIHIDIDKTEISDIIKPDRPAKDEPLILVVENDLKSNELLTLTLTGAGYSVIPAYTGKQALGAAHKYKPFAITLDIMLPGMDGCEVIKCLKDDPATRDIPILICTAKELTKDELQMLTHNAASIMQKGTFNSKQFIDEIKRIVILRS